jgi:hypothetical protein
MGGTLVRTIGLANATSKIGMKNPACNMLLIFQMLRLPPPSVTRSGGGYAARFMHRYTLHGLRSQL